MNETTLRELIAGIASETPAATEVDLGAAMTTAHQQRKRSRRIAVGSAAAIVTLILVAAALAVAAFGPRPAPVVTRPTSGPVVAPTVFDPAQTRLVAGWIPTGLGNWERRVTESAETLSFGAGYPLNNVTIQIDARGAPAGFSPIGLPTGTYSTQWSAGPDIHGQSSGWVAIPSTGKPGTTAGELEWKWAPDATAHVYVNGFPDAKAYAVRIANSLSFAEKRLALPFTLTPPAGSHLIGNSVSNVSAQGSISADDGRGYGFHQSYRAAGGVGPGVEVTADTTVTEPVNANQRVGPWDAAVYDSNWETGQVAFADPGHDLFVQITGVAPNSRRPTAVALAVQVTAGFRVNGSALDPTTWK